MSIHIYSLLYWLSAKTSISLSQMPQIIVAVFADRRWFIADPVVGFQLISNGCSSISPCKVSIQMQCDRTDFFMPVQCLCQCYRKFHQLRSSSGGIYTAQ